MSQTTCCVPGCSSTVKDLSLHRFPNPDVDLERFRTWVMRIGGDIVGLSDHSIYKNRKVCSKHFHHIHLYTKKLSTIAVPQLYISGVVLHAFPNPEKEPEKFRIWVINAGLLGEEEAYIFKNKRICHTHFEERYHYPKNRLSKLAIPTLPFSDSEKHGKSKVSLLNLQQSPRPIDDDIADDGNNATDIYSDDGDKDTKKKQFSWQKATQICIDDDDDCDDVPTTMDIEVEKKEEGKPNDANREDHKEYFCDNCCESIVGFRYRCVECENYDLCSRCEAQAQHARHYMLRVPRPRPFSEIKIIIDAIREKIKQLSEELQDNSLELDEIKLEPDFVDPAALDPLCTPRVQTPHIATDLPSHEVPLSPPPIATSYHIGSSATLLTHQNEAAKSRPNIATSNEIIMTSGTVPTHIATLQFKTPLTTTSQTSHKWADRPVYIIRDYTQKQPKARLKQNNTFQKPQTVPVMLDPTVLINKINLIKDNKETHINLIKDNEVTHEVCNTSKRKLTAFVEDAFNKKFKDMEETFKDCIENISDNGSTSGTGIKRKNIADIEETWLDEDILDEEVISTTEETDEDREECPSPRITRSATKAKQLSEEDAPDT